MINNNLIEITYEFKKGKYIFNFLNINDYKNISIEKKLDTHQDTFPFIIRSRNKKSIKKDIIINQINSKVNIKLKISNLNIFFISFYIDYQNNKKYFIKEIIAEEWWNITWKYNNIELWEFQTKSIVFYNNWDFRLNKPIWYIKKKIWLNTFNAEYITINKKLDIIIIESNEKRKIKWHLNDINLWDFNSNLIEFDIYWKIKSLFSVNKFIYPSSSAWINLNILNARRIINLYSKKNINKKDLKYILSKIKSIIISILYYKSYIKWKYKNINLYKLKSNYIRFNDKWDIIDKF